MAKAKAAARRRPGYEYDHHYGLSLQDGAVKPKRRGTSSRKKKAAKKR